MNLEQSHRIIIKVGSALLVNSETNTIHEAWLKSLIADIVQLMQDGKQVVLVSSGAIAFGRLVTKLMQRPTALDMKQALAAVGQVQLMHTYQNLFKAQGFDAAQVLITLEDTENRERFINLRNTLSALLDLNIIPIINENDSVATAEIRYGDNDRLAARVVQMIDADTLILLSDIDGLYTDDPRLNPAAKFIPEVQEITAEISNLAKTSKGNFGSGGMITKIEAAKIAVNSGCAMLITAGKHQYPITYYQKNKVGTWFTANTTAKSAKKIWLQEHLKSAGNIIIDTGAVAALKTGASLLAVGISKIEGNFTKGSTVDILDAADHIIARGLVNFSSHDLQKIVGQHSNRYNELLGYETSGTVIHRDNLVLL